MGAPSSTTPIITSDYHASAGEVVRASGTLSISLEPTATRDAQITVIQMGTGTVTIAAHIDGVFGYTVTDKCGVTLIALGSGRWAVVSTRGVDGGTP